MPRLSLALAAAASLALASPSLAQRAPELPLPAADQRLARDILEELVNINTTASSGSTTRAAEAIRRRFLAAGIPERDMELVGPDAKNQNFVARVRGRDAARRPILLFGHLDVVEAKREDWKYDPFVMREENGYLLGRGVDDDKQGVANIVANVIRWKREGWVPDRDLIVFFSADEESDAKKGIAWVLEHRRDLVDAEYGLNTDGGGVELKEGAFRTFEIEASEKVYVTFRLESKNRGGHSSVPRPDNAIYQLARALDRLAAYRFPVQLTEITRAEISRAAALERGERAADMRAVAERGASATAAIGRLSKDPVMNALLRTTCVATMLDGGHAENALPQSARATVNCRMMPGTPEADVARTLERVAGDSTTTVTRTYDAVPSPPSPLRPDVMRQVERLAARHFPGAVVIPSMALGASDGLYLRNAGIPNYALSALAAAEGETNAHGLDEKIRVDSFYRAVAYWYDLVRALAGGEEGKASDS
jgi:acetylornithine deacetylase/succinyl-diaminopimelate desuccinylase-like protein